MPTLHTHAAIAAAFILGALIATPASAQTCAGPQSKINVGVAVAPPNVVHTAPYIAKALGFFAKRCIDANIIQFDGGLAGTSVTAVGQGSAISTLPDTAIAQGLKAKQIWGLAPRPPQAYVVSADVKTPADLKGRTVGLSAPGSTSMYELAQTLASAGLALKDVDVKHLAFAQMASALQNGALDAALTVAPFTEIIIERNIARPWIDPEQGYIKTLPMTSVAYIVNSDWAAQNPDPARRLFLALGRGSRDYCQAYHHGPNRGEVLDMLMKHRIATDRALLDRMDWQARNPDGAFNLASLVDIQNFFRREGVIDRTAPPERLIDPRFADAAAKAFGPFVVANRESKLAGCR